MTTHTPHFDHDIYGKPTNWLGWTKAILLIGLGIDLAILIATGTLTYYISPHFAWLTHVAAGLLIFFGVLNALDLLRGNEHHHHDHAHDHDHDHDHAHDADCDHDHDHDHAHDAHAHHDHDHDHHHEEITWPILAVIAIPLLLGVLMPPEPLSAASVNGGITTASVGINYENVDAIPPTERNLLHWLHLFDEADDPAEFDGTPVELIGFVYEQPDFDDDHVMIVRFTISCCVADALAIGIPFNTASMDAPAMGEWIRITGTLEAGTFRDEITPIIQPEQIVPIDVPADPYLYTQ